MEKLISQEITEELLQRVAVVAQLAGEAILSIYQEEETLDVTLKEGGSPLTEADMASHHLICDYLKKMTPGIPILSEESSEAVFKDSLEWETYWLIDPLDGTKEFIHRTGEFTVNIALIQKGEPVLGVVVAPVQQATYFAMQEYGAFKLTGDDEHVYPISVRSPAKPLAIVASRRHGGEQMQAFLDQVSDYELVNAGSSLKICLVAEGKADIYPRLGLTSEWDTAAAHCILNCAGGKLYGPDHQPLPYNKENILNSYFIASSQAMKDFDFPDSDNG